jgi:hypothetical protein
MNSSLPVLNFKDDHSLAACDWEIQKEMSCAPDTGAPCEAICGCFITREAYAEPAIPCLKASRDEDFEWHPLQTFGLRGLRPLSENEAVVRLHRCSAETGQLVVRTADFLTDVWFAGIGDPERIFVEFFPRGGLASLEDNTRQWICPIGHAQKLLGDIYRGARCEELFEAMPAQETSCLPLFPVGDREPSDENIGWPNGRVAV